MPPNFNILDTDMPAKVAGSFGQGRRNSLSRMAAERQGQMQDIQLEQLEGQVADEATLRQMHKDAGGDNNVLLQNLVGQGMNKEAQHLQEFMFKQQTAKAGQVKEAARVKALQSFRGTLPEQQQPAFDVAPKEFIKQKFAAEKPSSGQRGQIIYDEKGRVWNVNPYTSERTAILADDGTQMTGAQYTAQLKGELSSASAEGGKTGGAMGEEKVSLADMESRMPQLEQLVKDLSVLGEKATYTGAGQISNTIRRQLGMDVGEGAIKRKEYVSKVNNEILPLLRITFGAAFTVPEGKELKATLGDPDATPAEKDAVLKSFIETKREQIKSLERRTGNVSQPSSNGLTAGQVVDGHTYLGGDPNSQSSWK